MLQNCNKSIIIHFIMNNYSLFRFSRIKLNCIKYNRIKLNCIKYNRIIVNCIKGKSKSKSGKVKVGSATVAPTRAREASWILYAREGKLDKLELDVLHPK